MRIGGDLEVGRIGYGAMRLTGENLWGDYPDRDGGIARVGSEPRFVPSRLRWSSRVSVFVDQSAEDVGFARRPGRDRDDG
jgi:hypothetical protein